MTGFDYNQFKRETLAAINQLGSQDFTPSRIEWLTQEQRKRLRGDNFITSERWAYRLLANRSILVEISYGWMMDHPVLGLTVFHKDDESWDHSMSQACFSIAELVERLTLLNEGREAIA